jgi:hypothetical protein
MSFYSSSQAGSLVIHIFNSTLRIVVTNEVGEIS